MIKKIQNYFVNTDKLILFIYLFLFITPWNIVKSQIAISSAIILIWSLYRNRSVFSTKISMIWKSKPLLFWVLFVLFCYVSVFWSDSFSDALKRVNNYHKYEFLFIPALLLSLNKNQAIVAIKVLLLSFVSYSIFSILIYLDFISIVGSSINNPKGILRFSISTQYMAITALSSIFFIVYSDSNKEKALFSIAFIISVFALFINYSRTSQLSFLLILSILMVVFLVKHAKNIKFYILGAFIIITITFAFSQNTKMTNKFNSAIKEAKNSYDNNNYNGSFGVRLYFNKVGLEILKDNFLFGVGPVDNRNKLVEIQKQDKEYKERIIKHYHSEHMEILTAYGFVGYSLIFLSIFLLIYKLRGEGIYYYLSLSVFLTLFFVSFANKTLALKPINYVYVIFLVLFSIIAYYEQNEMKKLSVDKD